MNLFHEEIDSVLEIIRALSEINYDIWNNANSIRCKRENAQLGKYP